MKLRSGTLRTAAVSAIVFAVAFLVRIANLPIAFAGGVPQFEPFDELYHAKRIAFSAANPLRVLSFDSKRGPHGAFCPWPPLYDMLAGAVARLLGGATAIAALTRAAWFPPIVASLVAAAVGAAVGRRRGAVAGLLAGGGVALSVYFVDKSRIGAIDHHFLEFPLALGVLLAALSATRARDERSALRSGGLLALAISLALFVQPALLLAAGIGALSLLILDREKRSPRIAGAAGFALSAAMLFAYRFLQPSGYPDSEWYLGLPHVALLLGAAAACVVQLRGIDRGYSTARSLWLGAAFATLVVAAVPGVLPTLAGGSQFFGGDPWLRAIREFRPIFIGSARSDWPVAAGNLGGGALLAIPILLDSRWRSGPRRVLLLFTIVYLLAALSSTRFLAVAAPLLAVPGALYCADLWGRGSRGRASVAAAVLLAPGLLFSLARVIEPPPAVGADALPVVRAVQTLSRPDARPGAVLAGWSWGHLFNVVGGRRVLVDNFGSWTDPTDFQNSTGITFATREKAVAEYCAARGVRFVVLENPLHYFAARAAMSGLPRDSYERPRGSGRPTRLMHASFWWRAYAEGGRARPDLGPAGAPFRYFQLIRVEPDTDTPEKDFAVQVWELSP